MPVHKPKRKRTTKSKPRRMTASSGRGKPRKRGKRGYA